MFPPTTRDGRSARLHKDLWKKFVEGSKSLTKGWVCYRPYLDQRIFKDIRPVFVKPSRNLREIYTNIVTSDIQDPMKEPKKHYLLEHGVLLDAPVLVEHPFCEVLHFIPGFNFYQGRLELPMDMPLQWIVALAIIYKNAAWEGNVLIPYSMHGDGCLVREEESIKLSELLSCITLKGVWQLECLSKKRGEPLLHTSKCMNATITLHISWLPNQAMFAPTLCTIIFYGTSLDENQCTILPGVIVVIASGKYYLNIQVMALCDERGVKHVVWQIDVESSYETAIDDISKCTERLKIDKRNVRFPGLAVCVAPTTSSL